MDVEAAKTLDPSDDDTSEAEEEPPRIGWKKDLHGLRKLLIHPLNVLLVFVPLGIASARLEWGDGPTFCLNFMALVPLAAILNAATETVAAHTGDLLGGLLNATIGNALEMMVTVHALRAGLVRVVQGSLLGSVLSNLLLVLGTSFLLGGIRFSEQGFNVKGASSNVSCLLLSSISMALPTLYRHSPGVTDEDVVTVSRISAIVVTLIYVLFLFFQLKTHIHLFVGEEEEEEPEMSLSLGLAVLVAAFYVTCVYPSDYLVHSIEGVTEQYKIPQTFISIILIPIVGNAVEHTTAVTAAMKNKMDLALGVAVGSSTQIALFVVPFSVLVGWGMDVDMTLDFHMFDAGVMILSVLIVAGVLMDGYSNWLEGAMLVATYALCAIMFWMTPDAPEGATAHAAARALAHVAPEF